MAQQMVPLMADLTGAPKVAMWEVSMADPMAGQRDARSVYSWDHHWAHLLEDLKEHLTAHSTEKTMVTTVCLMVARWVHLRVAW